MRGVKISHIFLRKKVVSGLRENDVATIAGKWLMLSRIRLFRHDVA
jgi:hypothetical protein